MKRLLLAIITSLTGLFSLAQWSNNPVEPFWVNTQDEYFYTYEVQMAPNGNTWLWYNSGEDFHYLQLFDSTGVARFGEEMLLVSDYENRLTGYVNQNLFVDRDGNAIVVVSDLRYSSISEDLATFTAYKISQEGEFLWGKDGISLDGGKGTHLAAMMGIVQLSDGSYVFTWTHGNDEDIFTIELQRLSAEGELLWNADETRLTDPQGKVTYFWPFIVEAEYGQCILLYTKGSNLDLYARKIDFDGSSVWSEDTRIYRSGFLSTPLWTLLCAQPSGDGGVIVTWYDDRAYTSIESIYMSYVKPNGELGFSAGEEGQKLGYSNFRALSTTCTYDPASDSFIAFWRESSQGQGSNRIVAQSVSKEGDLLWGENGLEIEPLQERIGFGDLQLRTARDGEIAMFYLRRNELVYHHIDVCMQLVDTREGKILSDSPCYITDSVATTYKTDLHVTNMADNESWVIAWDDRGVAVEDNLKRLYLHRVNYDGSVGNRANLAVSQQQVDMQPVAMHYETNGDAVRFTIDCREATNATLVVSDVNGQLVSKPFDGLLTAGRNNIDWSSNLCPGVYIATLTTPYGTVNLKLFI